VLARAADGASARVVAELVKGEAPPGLNADVKEQSASMT